MLLPPGEPTSRVAFWLAILGLPFLMLLPAVGIALLALALVLAGFGRFARA